MTYLSPHVRGGLKDPKIKFQYVLLFRTKSVMCVGPRRLLHYTQQLLHHTQLVPYYTITRTTFPYYIPYVQFHGGLVTVLLLVQTETQNGCGLRMVVSLPPLHVSV